jgi:hypothetical protein
LTSSVVGEYGGGDDVDEELVLGELMVDGSRTFGEELRGGIGRAPEELKVSNCFLFFVRNKFLSLTFKICWKIFNFTN